MKKTRNVVVILAMAVTFCFFLVSLPQADPGKKKVPKIPIWQITKEGTAKSVNWKDHKPNPRFALYKAGTPEEKGDDLVLDKETGLVWARDGNSLPQGNWEDAIIYCRHCNLGNRKGWRLPTIEELSSLVDISQSTPALPIGHPFINVQFDDYWSSTTFETNSARAWTIHMGGGFPTSTWFKTTIDLYVWPVRGGNGYATYNW